MVDEGGDEADEDGRPRVDRRTAGGDANERAEERVARVADVVEAGAAELLRQAALDEEARETAHCGGEGRGDGGARHGVRVAVDDQGGAGVEAVPAEPEEEGADELERRGVPIEVPGAFEAAGPRAEDLSAHQRREAAGHVHHAGAGKVDHTGHNVVFVEGGEEARAIPHPVHHDRVDEARDAERVDEVCH